MKSSQVVGRRQLCSQGTGCNVPAPWIYVPQVYRSTAYGRWTWTQRCTVGPAIETGKTTDAQKCLRCLNNRRTRSHALCRLFLPVPSPGGMLHQLSPNIRAIKSKRIRLAEHVTRTGETGGAYEVLVERPEGNRPLRRPRRRGKGIPLQAWTGT